MVFDQRTATFGTTTTAPPTSETLTNRHGYDLGDANAALARVQASKRVIDSNIDAMVSHDHPFDPEAILRRV